MKALIKSLWNLMIIYKINKYIILLIYKFYFYNSHNFYLAMIILKLNNKYLLVLNLAVFSVYFYYLNLVRF
jgi:hypothetical protein